MSTTLSYHSSRSRASERLGNVKSGMERSSAYIYGSNRSSAYEPLKRETSFTESTPRIGRSRTRDHSADFSIKMRRSSSLELSAPIKPRLRDRSTDFSVNGIERIASRPKTSTFHSKYEAKDYKDITTNADKYITMQKYSNYDKVKEIESTVEEERRSKAYSKIINQSNACQQDIDASRACMSDIFMNTNGFSTKTVSAINKEVLYKEEKGPKNYGWRKDMESYEEKLQVLSQHKRTVQESTKATRDVYRSTDTKIRDYERESRRVVESEPARTNLSSSTRPETRTYSTDSTYSSSTRPETRTSYTDSTYTATTRSDYLNNGVTKTDYSNGISSTNNEYEYNEQPMKKGSWRKDIEKFEDELNLKKVQNENQKKISAYDSSATTSASSFQSTQPASVKLNTSQEVNSKPTYSWKKSATEEEAPKKPTYSWKKPTEEEESSKKPTYSWKKPSEKSDEQVKSSYSWKKPEIDKKEEPKVQASNNNLEKRETVKNEATKTITVSKIEAQKPAPVQTEEKNVDAPKTTPKWKKPEPSKSEETKVETPKPTPKWKKPEPSKKEETKPEEKPTPKWKKPEPAKKEETKTETPKVTPKWKKPQTTKVEEEKTEEKKPVPKWKKPEAPKTQEKTTEAPKPTPKWKKPETVKQEEKPIEEDKPVPKWKKQTPVKKEEPKVEEPKPVPKWKKPESKKVEEQKVEEPKPLPKWKKPDSKKSEENIASKTPVPANKTEVNDSRNSPKDQEEARNQKVEKEHELNASNEESITAQNDTKDENKSEEKKEEEKKEEEEEEDTSGMRAMRKETDNKFADMDAEFSAGRSKLQALRAKMKRLREASKAAAEADAAAEAAARK